MYTDAELTAMATDLGSELVERKRALKGTKDKVCEAICAYSNDLPGHGRAGVIFIGLENDGRPSGLSITDELLLELAHLRDDGKILPLPSVSVRKLTLSTDTSVAVVEVTPSRDTPVMYSGRAWIRVGPRRGIASRAEETLLTERRRAGDLPFDRRPHPGARIEDLDLDRFRREYLPNAFARDVLAQNERTIEERLAALHLARGGRPTTAALLLFSGDPRQWIPSAYLQFVRFSGQETSDVIADQRELSGPIPDLVQRVDDILRANIHVRTHIGDSVHEAQAPDYPLATLQQIVRNALMHRTYEGTHTPARLYWFSDRVEVHSPGGPFGLVTPENFGEHGVTDYRNPSLAEGMKVYGFVQRFGAGLALASRACRENGNPAPEYKISPQAIAAIVRPREDKSGGAG